jgi:undecaprenyl-diphosphatase
VRVLTGWRQWASAGLRKARGELAAVAALLIAASGVWAFLSIAEEVGEGDTHSMDLAVLEMLRMTGDPTHAVGPPWLRESLTDVTALGSLTVLGLVVLLVAGLFASLRHWRDAAVLVGASLGGVAISQGLKAVFGRERPPEAFRIVEAYNPSFPSGHAMLSAVVFLTLGVLAARFASRRRVKVFVLSAAIVLTLLVGISRVFLGVHWATDVLAGWCVGAAWAMVCWLAVWVLGRGWRAPREAAVERETAAERTP